VRTVALRAPKDKGPMASPHRFIILYDGVCRLCATVVRFVYARDPAAKLSFCAIQSAAAAPLLAAAGVPPSEALKSFIFYDVEAGVALRRSSAALAIARHLGGAWAWVAWCAAWVPAPARDWLYDAVAARRYALFGKAEEGELCLAPTRRVLARFVDADEIKAALARKAD